MGYSAHRIRYTAFVIAGFFAGVAGGLSALLFEIVTAEVVSTARSGAYLIFTVLGGSGSFVGPMVGAVLMVCSTVLLSSWTRAWLLYLGLLFLFVVMFFPGGVVGALRALRRPASWWHPPHWPWRVLGVLAGALAVLGFAALVEMVYHLQWGAVVGSRLPFFGVVLDVQQPEHWWLAGLTLTLGGGLCWGLFRRGTKSNELTLESRP